jgi:D-alanyl-D-alanine carboxypeptidase
MAPCPGPGEDAVTSPPWARAMSRAMVFLSSFAADPYRYFPNERLAGYAMGGQATSGYHYSNTSHILAEIIIEKAARDSYQNQLYSRIIRPLGLRGTF